MTDLTARLAALEARVEALERAGRNAYEVEQTLLKRIEALETKRTRGTRIRKDWKPSGDEWKYARDQGLTDGETRAAAADFKDYWESQPGAKGVKLKWGLTWHTWVRRNAERLGRVSRAEFEGTEHQAPDQSEKVQAALKKLLPDSTGDERQSLLVGLEHWKNRDLTIRHLASRHGMRDVTMERQFENAWRQVSGQEIDWRAVRGE